MKKMFNPFICMLSNEDLRGCVRDALDKVPTYFWEIPASSSGKYHPAHDLGVGGLVRHTVMVMQCALDLARSEEENPDPLYLDAILVACMFHDCLKNGLENGGHTVFNHPALAFEFVLKNFYDYDSCFAVEVAKAVYCHMGRWNTNQKGEILRLPHNRLEKTVHLADYIASRKYVTYMPI